MAALAEQLDTYHLFHAVRADLLRDLGQRDLAHTAHLRALALTDNEVERSLIRQRMSS